MVWQSFIKIENYNNLTKFDADRDWIWTGIIWFYERHDWL